jgi:hypothetical protein
LQTPPHPQKVISIAVDWENREGVIAGIPSNFEYVRNNLRKSRSGWASNQHNSRKTGITCSGWMSIFVMELGRSLKRNLNTHFEFFVKACKWNARRPPRWVWPFKLVVKSTSSVRFPQFATLLRALLILGAVHAVCCRIATCVEDGWVRVEWWCNFWFQQGKILEKR